eukprot:SAG31_NODE_23760_length_496_cov_6.138539_2_plen_54_part_01
MLNLGRARVYTRTRSLDARLLNKELGSLCGRGVVEVTRYRDLFFKINRSGEHSC